MQKVIIVYEFHKKESCSLKKTAVLRRWNSYESRGFHWCYGRVVYDNAKCAVVALQDVTDEITKNI